LPPFQKNCWWKLETQDWICQKVVREKYLQPKTMANVKARFNSPSCKALLNVKVLYGGKENKYEQWDLMRF
jgi:hypothetical protein